MLVRILRHPALRRSHSKAWELSTETLTGNNISDAYYQLSPVAREQVQKLPDGTLAVRPVDRPSSIDLLKMEMNDKMAALDVKLAALDVKLAAQDVKLAALNIRIQILENHPKIIQIFESIKRIETNAIDALLPAEAYVLPKHLRNLNYLKGLLKENKAKPTESIKQFFDHPLVKVLYEFMESKEYDEIRSIETM